MLGANRMKYPISLTTETDSGTGMATKPGQLESPLGLNMNAGSEKSCFF